MFEQDPARQSSEQRQLENLRPELLKSGAGGITFLDFPQELRIRIIEKHLDWIKEVAQETVALETLNDRTIDEMINILFCGYGDILFIDEGGVNNPVSLLLKEGNDIYKPVSTLFLTQAFTVPIQKELYARLLGLTKNTRMTIEDDEISPELRRRLWNMVYNSLRRLPFYESNLGYTHKDHRRKGYNSHLRNKLYQRKQYEGLVIGASNCNPNAMAMFAREGFTLLPYKEFPLTATVISFGPGFDVFNGVKIVPELDDVRWMSMDGMKQWIEFLAIEVEGGVQKVRLDDLPKDPVVLVSMQDRLGFLTNPSAEAYRRALPDPRIVDLELTLQHVIWMSRAYCRDGYCKRGEQGQVEYLHQGLLDTSRHLQKMLLDASI
jgi:GNAT superfamily N-acetyltransferase